MKKSLLIIYLIFSFCLGFSQQKANNTLYEWNRIDFNPGFCGASNTTDITILARQQWVGFTDAPRTQYISAHAILPGNIGIGGVIYNNVAGPTRQTGVKAGYAKHLKINRDLNLSLALSLDAFQNIYDQGKLNTGLPSDPVIVGDPIDQKLTLDASVGAVLYTNNYYVGLSCTNVLQSKYDFLTTGSDFENPIYRTFYFTGGYAFVFPNELKYSPGLLVKKTIGLPLELDICNRFYYDFLLAGISYRTSNDMSFILGAQFAEFYEIAYSFDYSLSSLKNYSSGSHEILLRFKLKNYSGGDSRRHNKATFLW